MNQEKDKTNEKNKEIIVHPLCMNDPDVVAMEHNDTVINGVTYRVWSAFEEKKEIEESLSELMLRQLESEEEEGISLV